MTYNGLAATGVGSAAAVPALLTYSSAAVGVLVLLFAALTVWSLIPRRAR